MCRFLTFFIACLFALQLSAKSSSKEPQVDFSIIERTNELSAYLNSSQRIELVRIEEAISRAEEQIRSGKFMMDRKPSSLNPNEDLKPVHERGKKLAEEGQEALIASQVKLVKLLETAASQRVSQQQALSERYQFTLNEMTYPEALEQSAQAVLRTAWAEGYTNILYDGVRRVDGGVSSDAGVEVRNQSYDILIALDGTRFSVNMPINLKLIPSDQGALRFSYDNESAFTNAKTALLAIEQINFNGGSESVLSVRAIDLSSFQLIGGQVIALDSDTESETVASTNRPTSGKINDQRNLLSTLASLETPYEFGWDLSKLSNPDRALAYSMLLQQTIQQNVGLKILETDFLTRTYLEAADPAEIAQQPSAVFQLEPADDAPEGESYTLSARLTSNNREVVIGMANFNNEAAN